MKITLTKEKIEDIVCMVADTIMCKNADAGDYEYKVKSKELPESITITINELQEKR